MRIQCWEKEQHINVIDSVWSWSVPHWCVCAWNPFYAKVNEVLQIFILSSYGLRLERKWQRCHGDSEHRNETEYLFFVQHLTERIHTYVLNNWHSKQQWYIHTNKWAPFFMLLRFTSSVPTQLINMQCTVSVSGSVCDHFEFVFVVVFIFSQQPGSVVVTSTVRPRQFIRLAWFGVKHHSVMRWVWSLVAYSLRIQCENKATSRCWIHCKIYSANEWAVCYFCQRYAVKYFGRLAF